MYEDKSKLPIQLLHLSMHRMKTLKNYIEFCFAHFYNGHSGRNVKIKHAYDF